MHDAFEELMRSAGFAREPADDMRTRGDVYCELVGSDGAVKRAWGSPNAFVDVGRDFIRDQVYDTGASDLRMGRMAIGDGTGATTDGMTALQNELDRQVYTFLSQAQAGQLVASASFTGLDATVSEVCIIEDLASGGTMMARALLSPFATISVADTLKIRYTASHT